MLDKLWTLDSLQEIEDFKDQLPLFRRQQVDTLIELVRLQMIDDEIDRTQELEMAQLMLVPFIEKNY